MPPACCDGEPRVRRRCVQGEVPVRRVHAGWRNKRDHSILVEIETHGVEWVGQAHADGLDDGLLERPQLEETNPRAIATSVESDKFVLGEAALAELIDVNCMIDALHVHADCMFRATAHATSPCVCERLKKSGRGSARLVGRAGPLMKGFALRVGGELPLGRSNIIIP